MSNDPHSPDYVPRYTGAPGDYGSGAELGADLYQLYYAGQLKIPTTAGQYAEAVTALHWASKTFADMAWDLPHPVGQRIKDQMYDLEEAMRISTNRLYAAGDALVDIADTYAKTDEAASTEFGRLLNDPTNSPMFDHPPATITPPNESDPAGDPPEDLPTSEGEIEDILDDAGIEDQLEEQQDDEDDQEDGE